MTLTPGAPAYQAGLPAALARARLRCRVIRCGPTFDVTDWNFEEVPVTRRKFPMVRFANRALWAAWRRVPFTGRSRYPQALAASLIGRATAPYVECGGGVFHGLTTLSMETLERVRGSGTATLIECTVQHPHDWQREILRECATFGISPRDCDAVLPNGVVRRMLREFELCDAIVVPSNNAKQSFLRYPQGQKAVVVWFGIDHEHYFPPAAPPEKFRALFVGRLELGKGVPYLLRAWKRLRLPNSELVLVGEVRPEMRRILSGYLDASITVAGAVGSEKVGNYIRRASLLVMPSVNEGLARVMLEAMSCEVPVVATELSGAPDCVVDGRSGLIVPARDDDALAGAIQWCYSNPEEARAMGVIGRQIVLRNFTLADYERRQIALYREFLSGGSVEHLQAQSLLEVAP